MNILLFHNTKKSHLVSRWVPVCCYIWGIHNYAGLKGVLACHKSFFNPRCNRIIHIRLTLENFQVTSIVLVCRPQSTEGLEQYWVQLSNVRLVMPRRFMVVLGSQLSEILLRLWPLSVTILRLTEHRWQSINCRHHNTPLRNYHTIDIPRQEPHNQANIMG